MRIITYGQSPSGIEAHPFEMAITIGSALVNSRLDYANSELYDTSSGNMLKLQRVTNSLVRVVTYTKHAKHIHPVPLASDQLPYQLQGGDTDA